MVCTTLSSASGDVDARGDPTGVVSDRAVV